MPDVDHIEYYDTDVQCSEGWDTAPADIQKWAEQWLRENSDAAIRAAVDSAVYAKGWEFYR